MVANHTVIYIITILGIIIYFFDKGQLCLAPAPIQVCYWKTEYHFSLSFFSYSLSFFSTCVHFFPIETPIEVIEYVLL